MAFIKPNRHLLVKQGAFLFALLALKGSAFAEDPPPPPPPEQLEPVTVPMQDVTPPDTGTPETAPLEPSQEQQQPQETQAATSPTSPSSNDSALPEIEARKFDVKVVRKSKNKRIYLIDDPTGHKPNIGRILLFKDGTENVMAFRVLKTYDDKSQFAAKRVRSYEPYLNQELPDGQGFMAIEKKGDIAPYVETPQDKKDINELETLPPPDASTEAAPEENASTELPQPGGDEGTPQVTENTQQQEEQQQNFDGDEDEDSTLGVYVDEPVTLDPNPHWLSGGVAYLRNGHPEGGATYFAGGGFRYARTAYSKIYFKKNHMQDSLAFEGGMYFYKIINFSSNRDSYTVVPILATARYNLLFSQGFGVFGYTGLMKNVIVASANTVDAGLDAFSLLVPTIGAGMIFRVGPNWEARFDVGIDAVALGLMLRF